MYLMLLLLYTVRSRRCSYPISIGLIAKADLRGHADWDDSESSLSQIATSIKGASESLNTTTSNAGNNAANAGAGGAAGKTGTTSLDSLWEDNWDDDDIEDDFSVQLRWAHSLLAFLT